MDEWEKNQVKRMFRDHDKDKTGLTKEDLKKLMRKLASDDCIIGKVPYLSDADVSKDILNYHYLN